MRRIDSLQTLLAILLLASASALSACGTTAPTTRAGVSADRLKNLDSIMQRYVDDGKLAGIVAAVARRDTTVHFKSYGVRDIATGLPMQTDTIFRIFSMTKPIACIAVMMLYEEGRFQLDDPVGMYIPELADLEVYVDNGTPQGDRVKARRPITIRDMLAQRSGFAYGSNPDHPVDRMYREQEVLDYNGTLRDMIEKLGKLPLLFHPGERWHYGVNVEVLGYLVQVVSGQRFDRFLQERIFDPLGMVDTGFHVPPEKHRRLASIYALDAEGNLAETDQLILTDQFKRPATFYSGGGGLVSTTADYMRFARLLVNGGQLDGDRLVSRKTIELMTIDHNENESGPGYGFGLGFRVLRDLERAGTIGSLGEYGWAGAANTFFFVDPTEDMVGVFMTQFMPFGYYPVMNHFKTGVYQVIAD